MRCHVPFAHRHRPPGPIYIGFEQPVSIQRRKRRFNWAGFTGLLLALVSPLTLFLAAPFALVLCLVGLRRAPRGMAVVGLMLSLAATTVLSLGIVGVAHHRAGVHQQHLRHVAAIRNQPLIAETRTILGDVQKELREYRDDNQNYLPGLEEGMMITVNYLDGWDRELFYEPVDDGCLVRSAGPDGEFHTGDDVVASVAGKVDNGPIETN
jgi:hypothetical protein